jgi:hypothetical protein
MENNFAKLVLENGGDIKPLIIPMDNVPGPSLTNPTVLVDNGNIIVNLRNINYILYHSELSIYEHGEWGPLCYLHPENDITLTTFNYILKLNENLEIFDYHKIDTSKFDTYKPQWEFVGLEDIRLIKWDNKIYCVGVRRDLDTIGTGRMELSEIKITKKGVEEVSRFRIPGPPPDNEYCMKNCTPIEDNPNTLLKWTNSTSLMKFDPTGIKPTEVIETEEYIPGYHDMRGGSQVIKYKDGYLTIVHETYLYTTEQGKKNATYRHRFVMWDKDFKNKKFSKLFSFLNMNIEFCCGLAEYKNYYLITFGAQDNAAYILKVPKTYLETFLNE